jgi:exodeoxyribonuclease VII small subunit
MAKTPTPVESLSYEQALGELEIILNSLENETHDLQRTMELFERSRALISRCQELLDSAELRVSQLSANGEMTDLEGAD